MEGLADLCRLTGERHRLMGIRNLPVAFWVYLLGLVILVLLGFLPSEIQTTYSWSGALLFVGLVIGLAWGSNICRWILVCIGVLGSFANMSLQSPPIEVIATGWSVAALVVTSLLLTRSMREHTSEAG